MAGAAGVLFEVLLVVVLGLPEGGGGGDLGDDRAFEGAVGGEFSDDGLGGLLLVVGLDRFADSAVIVRVRTKTKPIRQWAVGREFNRRMKKKFDELGIEIPFPHMTLYMGQGKDGGAAPMNVNMINKNN